MQQIPELPKKPEYYHVLWYKCGDSPALYCVDADSAINLLRNRELDKGYQEEMKAILEGLR